MQLGGAITDPDFSPLNWLLRKYQLGHDQKRERPFLSISWFFGWGGECQKNFSVKPVFQTD
jgi:hypothetical protein